MDRELYRKAFFGLIFVVLISVSFLIVKPFLTPILTAIIMSYIFYPVYKTINKKILSKNISSLITLVLVVLVITLPFVFVFNRLSKEAYTIYLISRQKIASGNLMSECKPADKAICKTANYIKSKVNDPKVRYYYERIAKGGTTIITNLISDIILSVPLILLDIFIMLFVMFFLFKDGAILVNKVESIMPLKDEYRKYVMQKLNDMAYAVIYGSIIIAVVQGTLGGIGFFIFGLPSPLLWGIAMAFASLIPYVGSSIIWLPASLMVIIDGYSNFDTWVVAKGIILIAYCIIFVSTMDNILKPKIIGEKGGLHPVLVLLGVVGGLKFLGPVGFIIGPILLALLVTFINIYEEEKQTVLV